MKYTLTESILLSLMIVLLMIGGHQMYVIGWEEGLINGFLKSYWIFMFLLILMVYYQSRKNKTGEKEAAKTQKQGIVKGKKVKKKH